CGHKVHVISGVTGEGISTVLRAMAREIGRRRAERAEQTRQTRPVPVPRTRAERQAVNFNAPVVPKARAVLPQKMKSAKPATVEAATPKATAPVKAPINAPINGQVKTKAKPAK